MAELASKVAKMESKPVLAEFLIGTNPVNAKYAELKQKIAEKIGVNFCLYKFDEKDTQAEIIAAIEFLNTDPETSGIMIQIPIPKKFDRDELIGKISPAKDVDGLRFCANLDSDFKPPVVLSILEAIERSGRDVKTSKVALIGHGFLVGQPLERALREVKSEKRKAESIKVFESKDNLEIFDCDIVISATGSPNLIKPEMVKEGVVLIDAGTAEENGELRGDIDPEAYAKASYYTPVPGGIGPVTVAMLLKNLVG